MTPRSGVTRSKVIDFGLARIAPRTEATGVLAASRRGGLSQFGTAIAGT